MMSTFEIVITFVNIAAVIIAPIAAVKIGQSLQDKAQRRKDKMDIFKTLMTTRYSWTVESVQAMNVIEIVFADDNKVCSTWKAYHEKCCVQSPTDVQLQQIKTAKEKLLESMANSLGYKDQVTWETIQNPYVPDWMLNAMQQQQTIQNGQEELAKAMAMLLQLMMTNAASQNSQQQEDKPDANT
jgi:hypothetical protein